MFDWIKHEPALFGGVVQGLFGLVAVFLPSSVSPEQRAAVVAFGTSIAVWVRSMSTPNAKLP